MIRDLAIVCFYAEGLPPPVKYIFFVETNSEVREVCTLDEDEEPELKP
jgi:hypothetical protein